MGEMILYRSEDGRSDIQLRLEGGAVWLSQLEMADLFATTKQNVSLHIHNILKEKELNENSTVKESLTVQKEGRREVKRKTILYRLEMILAVGYRVKGQRGTQFRQWATANLTESMGQSPLILALLWILGLGSWVFRVTPRAHPPSPPAQSHSPSAHPRRAS